MTFQMLLSKGTFYRKKSAAACYGNFKRSTSPPAYKFAGKLCLFCFLRYRLLHCKIVPHVSFTPLYISYIIQTVAPSSLQLVHRAELSPLIHFPRSPVVFPLPWAFFPVPRKHLLKYPIVLFRAHLPLKLPLILWCLQIERTGVQRPARWCRFTSCCRQPPAAPAPSVLWKLLGARAASVSTTPCARSGLLGTLVALIVGFALITFHHEKPCRQIPDQPYCLSPSDRGFRLLSQAPFASLPQFLTASSFPFLSLRPPQLSAGGEVPLPSLAWPSSLHFRGLYLSSHFLPVYPELFSVWERSPTHPLLIANPFPCWCNLFFALLPVPR